MGTLIGGKDAINGSKDPKLGLVAIAIQWHADTLEEAITGTIPSIGLDGLVENQPRKFVGKAAGPAAGYDVTSVVEGHLTPTAADDEEFEINAATSEDKIETHPQYDLLLTAFDGTEDPQTHRGVWPRSYGNINYTGKAARNPMHGVDSYLVPGITWTRKWVAQSLKLSYIKALGTIDNPPGNPPELDGNRSWLFVRITGTFRGNIWQFSASWLLSGPEGWIPEMYRQSP